MRLYVVVSEGSNPQLSNGWRLVLGTNSLFLSKYNAETTPESIDNASMELARCNTTQVKLDIILLDVGT
jgi:hypothetical protein